MAIYKNEPCFIYYFWQLQDHSLLVEALSRSIGSIDIFIPNGRCKDLPLPHEFQPYTLMYLTLRHERADQPYLLTDYSFSSISYQLPPPESFKTLYINELLHLLFRNRRSNYQFFDSYQSTLEAIRSNRNVDFSILNFENFLFQNLNLPIYSVNNGQPIVSNKKYQFSLSTGFVEVQSDSTDHIFWNQLNKNTHWQSAPLPPSDPNNQKLTLSGTEIHDILNLEFKQPNHTRKFKEPYPKKCLDTYLDIKCPSVGHNQSLAILVDFGCSLNDFNQKIGENGQFSLDFGNSWLYRFWLKRPQRKVKLSDASKNQLQATCLNLLLLLGFVDETLMS